MAKRKKQCRPAKPAIHDFTSGGLIQAFVIPTERSNEKSVFLNASDRELQIPQFARKDNKRSISVTVKSAALPTRELAPPATV
jgi:hypothetical protein